MSARIQKIYVEVGDFVTKARNWFKWTTTTWNRYVRNSTIWKLLSVVLTKLYKVGGVSKAEWDAQKTSLEVMSNQYKPYGEPSC